MSQQFWMGHRSVTQTCIVSSGYRVLVRAFIVRPFVANSNCYDGSLQTKFHALRFFVWNLCCYILGY